LTNSFFIKAGFAGRETTYVVHNTFDHVKHVVGGVRVRLTRECTHHKSWLLATGVIRKLGTLQDFVRGDNEKLRKYKSVGNKKEEREVIERAENEKAGRNLWKAHGHDGV
jgi:hypothetical protein